MKIHEASASGAGQKLLAYIREHYGTVPAFSEAHGIVRQKIQKVLRGKCRRIDVDFAVAIQRATQGAISVEEWETPACASELP